MSGTSTPSRHTTHSHHRLLKIVQGSLTEQDLEQGKRWTQALMDTAYAGQSLSDGTHAVVLEITCGRMW